MKCQILFSGKNKKNIINLSSYHRVVKVNRAKESKNECDSLNVQQNNAKLHIVVSADQGLQV